MKSKGFVCLILLICILVPCVAFADCNHETSFTFYDQTDPVFSTSQSPSYYQTEVWVCMSCGEQIYRGPQTGPYFVNHTFSTATTTTGHGKNASNHWDLQTITEKCSGCGYVKSKQENVQANLEAHIARSWYTDGGHATGSSTHYYYLYCKRAPADTK